MHGLASLLLLRKKALSFRRKTNLAGPGWHSHQPVVISAVRGGHTNVFWDIALRDFGLLLAALALARLASVYAPNPFRRAQ